MAVDFQNRWGVLPTNSEPKETFSQESDCLSTAVRLGPETPGSSFADVDWAHLPIGILGVSFSSFWSHLARTFVQNSLVIKKEGVASALSLLNKGSQATLLNRLPVAHRWLVSFTGALAFYGAHKIWNMALQGEELGTLGENCESFLYTWGMFGFTASVMGSTGTALQRELGWTPQLGAMQGALAVAEYASFWGWEIFEGVARTFSRQLVSGGFDGQTLAQTALHTCSTKAMVERGAFMAGMKTGGKAFEPVQEAASHKLSLQQLREAVQREWTQVALGSATAGAAISLAAVSPNLSLLLGAAGALGMTLGPTLELRQSQQLAHTLQQADINTQFEVVYEQAEKRVYNQHGLQFEYAVVTREQLPYMMALGSAGLCYGKRLFVMKDFFVSPRVTPAMNTKIVELIAVHEYGERVFRSHHEASLLEFAVAEREGILGEYLQVMQQEYQLKFRDIALHRMGEQLLGSEGPIKTEPIEVESGPSAEQARRLRDSFKWPETLRTKYEREIERRDWEEEAKVAEWRDKVTVNEQVRGYLERASFQALKAAREAREVSPAERRSRAEAAFYGELRKLAEELEGPLERSHIVEEVVGKTLERVRGELREVDWGGNPLPERTLDQHLNLLKLEADYLKGSEFERKYGTERDEAQWQARVEQGRKDFWRDAQADVVAGRADSLEGAFAQRVAYSRCKTTLQREIEDHFSSNVDSFLTYRLSRVRGHASLPLALAYLEKGVIWQLAEVARRHPEEFTTIRDADLQGMVDQQLAALEVRMRNCLPEVKGELPKPLLTIDSAALRGQHGKALERYRLPSNEPESWFLRDLTTRFKAEEPGPAQEPLARLLIELARPNGDLEQNGPIIAQRVESGELPEAVGARMLAGQMGTGPFLRPQRANGLLPHLLIGKHSLSFAQARLIGQLNLLQALFPAELNRPIVWQAAAHYFGQNWERGGWTGRSLEAHRQLLAGVTPEKLADFPADFEIFSDYARLAAEVARDGLDAVRGRVEAELGMPAPEVNRMVFDASRARISYEERFDAAERFHDRRRTKPIRFKDAARREAYFQGRLEEFRRESAADLAFFRERLPEPLRTPQWLVVALRNLDQHRRASLTALLGASHAERMLATAPVTLVDLPTNP